MLALIGLYGLIASLVPFPPFRGLTSVPDLLDDAIRRGRDERERITWEPLEASEATSVVAAWTLRTANRLCDRFPAIADEFLLAEASEEGVSGPVLWAPGEN